MAQLAELRRVKLSQIDPNPFRDIAEWPTIKEKVAEIAQSFRETGFWDGYMSVRAAGSRYEQAFGYHRLVAAKEVWGEDHAITVTVTDLSNDQMAKMMAAENSETYGQRFYYATMQPIASIVKAYAEGWIELEKIEPTTRNLRYAPGFHIGGTVNGTAYTAVSIARYLGWVKFDKVKGSDQAAERVHTALAALELIESRVLNRSDFVHLTATQAKVLVDVTRARIKAETANTDATIDVKTDALKKAESNGDTNKAKTLQASIDDLTAKGERQAAKAGKAAATKALDDIAHGKSAREIVEGARPKSEGTETRAVKSATQVLYDLIAKWENICLETDAKWARSGDASDRAKAAAKTTLLALSERAKNRAEEV